MGIDAALNLFWAAIAVAAPAAFAVWERGRKGVAPRRPGWRRGLAVFIATVALFPCVSASDDLVRFEVLPLGVEAPTVLTPALDGRSSQKPAIDLARLLEALDNFQMATGVWILVTLGFFSLVRMRHEHGRDRFLPCRASRAPPSFCS